jgi:hypothetical protein
MFIKIFTKGKNSNNLFNNLKNIIMILDLIIKVIH